MLILLQRLCRPRRGSVVLLLSSLAPPSQFASCSLSASQKGWGRGGLGQVGSYSADTVLSWLCVLWFFWRHLLNQVISTFLTETVTSFYWLLPVLPRFLSWWCPYRSFLKDPLPWQLPSWAEACSNDSRLMFSPWVPYLCSTVLPSEGVLVAALAVSGLNHQSWDSCVHQLQGALSSSLGGSRDTSPTKFGVGGRSPNLSP